MEEEKFEGNRVKNGVFRSKRKLREKAKVLLLIVIRCVYTYDGRKKKSRMEGD